MLNFTRLALLFAALTSTQAMAQLKPDAYNLIQGAPGPYDEKVMSILGEYYNIRHFRNEDHSYKAPRVLEGEPPTSLSYMEDGNPVQATGVIHVYFVIEADGTVRTAVADRQSGCECLEKYVTDTIKEYRFRPAKIDGEAVATTALQFYEFAEQQ